MPSAPPYQPKFNYPNNKLYQYEAYPVLLSCNFVVDATVGTGIRAGSLKGAGIANVFMHTSTTPSVGNYGKLNPNPAAGIILVQLENSFNRFLCGFEGMVSPPTSGTLTATVANVTYVITSLGTATTAQWVAKGFPVGITPAVGAAFVATATGTIGGSAAVQAPTTSGIAGIEVIGDPNATLRNSDLYANGGAQFLLQTLGGTFTAGAYTPAGTVAAPVLTINSYTPAGTNDSGTPPLFTGTPATLTGTNSAPAFTGTPASLTGTIALAKAAPAVGSLITLSFYLSNSSVSISGQ